MPVGHNLVRDALVNREFDLKADLLPCYHLDQAYVPWLRQHTYRKWLAAHLLLLGILRFCTSAQTALQCRSSVTIC